MDFIICSCELKLAIFLTELFELISDLKSSELSNFAELSNPINESSKFINSKQI